MAPKWVKLACAVAATLVWASAATAADFLMPRHDDGSALTLGVGAYDTGAFGGNADTAAQFALEYRHDLDLLLGIKPWVGGFVTTDQTLYGGAGLYRDFELIENLYFTPMAGIGAWGRGDAEKDLGHVLEFRTGAELTYRFANGSRIGVQFFHLSNASISEQNPGEESFQAIYVLPLRELGKLM